MDVQVSIRISRESIAEVAEIFKNAFSNVTQTGATGVPPAQPVPAANPAGQPAAVPVQQSVPQTTQTYTGQPAPQMPQTYSGQIAQQTQLPVQAMTGAPVQPQGVPTTAVPQEYTQDQVAVALTGLIDMGRRDLVTQILGMFGAQALTQIPKERYPELVLKLREAGANI